MRRPGFYRTVTVVLLGFFVSGLPSGAYIFLHSVQPLTEDAFTLAYVEKIYFPTHTRLDGLLVGVTLAAIKTFRPEWWQRALRMDIFCS